MKGPRGIEDEPFYEGWMFVDMPTDYLERLRGYLYVHDSVEEWEVDRPVIDGVLLSRKVFPKAFPPKKPLDGMLIVLVEMP
uniref:Uncharacterized protein n=1 Tax=viral metagenome TaxID=1070528 RepID=A0A6M3KSM7_9ZZZZ